MPLPKKPATLSGNFTQLPNPILRSETLSIRAKMLWVVLASYNPSRPSQKTLRKLLSEAPGKLASPKTVTKAKKELLDQGLVLEIKRGNFQSRLATEYQVMYSATVSNVFPKGTDDVFPSGTTIIPKNNTNKEESALLTILSPENNTNSVYSPTVPKECSKWKGPCSKYNPNDSSCRYCLRPIG